MLALVFENAEMAKKSKPKKRKPIWFAREWMATKNLRNRDIVAETRLSPSQVSEFLNGDQRINEDVLILFAAAIGIEPYDLLRLPYEKDELTQTVESLSEPDRARALRLLKALKAAA